MENIEVINKIAKHVFNAKISNKSYLILNYGPPGSGKTSMFGVNKFIEQINLSKKNIVDINLDNIVNEFDAVKKASIQDKNEIYMRYRRFGEEIARQLLRKSLLYGYHTMFEVTGKNVEWLKKLTRYAKKQGYIIITIYSYASLPVLIDRVQTRAKKIGRKPDNEYIKESYVMALKNIIEDKWCDEVFVYENEKINDFVLQITHFDSESELLFRDKNSKIPTVRYGFRLMFRENSVKTIENEIINKFGINLFNLMKTSKDEFNKRIIFGGDTHINYN